LSHAQRSTSRRGRLWLFSQLTPPYRLSPQACVSSSASQSSRLKGHTSGRFKGGGSGARTEGRAAAEAKGRMAGRSFQPVHRLFPPRPGRARPSEGRDFLIEERDGQLCGARRVERNALGSDRHVVAIPGASLGRVQRRADVVHPARKRPVSVRWLHGDYMRAQTRAVRQKPNRRRKPIQCLSLVQPPRLERGTPRSTIWCSNQLSYGCTRARV
jgi:hypothetical protein